MFLPETNRHRALIFGMQHHQAILIHVCSNNGPMVKKGPALWITCYISNVYLEKT